MNMQASKQIHAYTYTQNVHICMLDTHDKTDISVSIYIYIYIEREREREREIHFNLQFLLIHVDHLPLYSGHVTKIL